MTLDEKVEKVVDLLSEEEAYEFLKGIANDDIVLVGKIFLHGVLRLPKKDINAFIDAEIGRAHV